MEKMNGKTLDIVADNIAKLKEIFPEIFNEDKVDFQKLENVLGEYKDNGTERYNFSWPGKSKAIRIAQTPSTGTLRPCKEESKNWDETGNLYIEGDNLEVLKILQKSYYGKVKMIYIDPPYNTGKDFVYKDDFKDNVENYLAITGQKDEEGNKTSTNTESNGRYHSNWLNMMYPRLRLARNLLKDDGVIFISIDDNEINNLRKMCDEIFGEENFAAQIIWEKVYSPRMDVTGFSTSHDYILCYVKSDLESVKREPFQQNLKQFNYYDDINKNYYRRRSIRKEGSNSLREDAPKSFFSLKAPDGTEVFPIKPDGTEGCWRWSISTYEENLENGFVEWVETQNGWQVYAKQFQDENATKPPETIWKNEEVNHNHGAAEYLKKLMNGKYFDSPKPRELLKKILKISTDNEDIVLDFFSGSATTGEAIIDFNCENNTRLKSILVQIPEKTNDGSEAFKSGYRNICEIAKERIRRAGEKIKEENKDKEGIEDLDIGFKVFKLDSSNINKWEPAYEQNLESTLLASIENIKTGRSEEDILYEVLLKYGIDLNMPIEEHIVNDKKVFDIGFGAIIACLDKDITLELVEGIGKLKEQLEPDTCRVVFMDNGFSSDSIKTNAVQILKRYNIEDVKCI
ncbi:site-specific DNA-methyltransferase [Clostridium botulinum]|nr:site-specific DNA-methyltransferase [Clostridium botulinum]